MVCSSRRSGDLRILWRGGRIGSRQRNPVCGYERDDPADARKRAGCKGRRHNSCVIDAIVSPLKQYVVTVDGGHGSFGTKLGDYVRAYALP